MAEYEFSVDASDFEPYAPAKERRVTRPKLVKVQAAFAPPIFERVVADAAAACLPVSDMLRRIVDAYYLTKDAENAKPVETVKPARGAKTKPAPKPPKPADYGFGPGKPDPDELPEGTEREDGYVWMGEDAGWHPRADYEAQMAFMAPSGVKCEHNQPVELCTECRTTRLRAEHAKRVAAALADGFKV